METEVLRRLRMDEGVGIVRVNGRRLAYRDGGWRPFIEEFRDGNCLPADFGVRVRHRRYSGATGSPWEYPIDLVLWRIDDFFVLVDEGGADSRIFESRDEALAAYREAVDELEGGE
jgi:hypothetical protein